MLAFVARKGFQSLLSRSMDGESKASTLALKEDPKNIQTPSLASSSELNQPPKSDFLDHVQSLFSIFDAEKKGYVTIDEFERYLSDNEDITKMDSNAKNLALIHALQQICPANGCINFKRFNLAIQIALGKRSPGKEKGIGRSLRPRSFLFAVTEVGDNDADIKQNNGYEKEKRMSYSPADSVISSDMDESSETIDSAEFPSKSHYYQPKKNIRSKAKILESEKGRMAIEEFFVLQKCLLETNKVREIYRARIAELEEAIEEDKHIAISSTFDYSHAALHISKIQRMNEKLELSQLPNSSTLTKENIRDYFEPQKKIDELTFCVRQLENEKSALVRDYFCLKARYAELEGKQKDNALF